MCVCCCGDDRHRDGAVGLFAGNSAGRWPERVLEEGGRGGKRWGVKEREESNEKKGRG